MGLQGKFSASHLISSTVSPIFTFQPYFLLLFDTNSAAAKLLLTVAWKIIRILSSRLLFTLTNLELSFDLFNEASLQHPSHSHVFFLQIAEALIVWTNRFHILQILVS